MNSSTSCNLSSANTKRRQSSFTLAFFCIIIIAFSMFSCSENIFSTPFGNKTLAVDTLKYDSNIISLVKNLNVNASGNAVDQNKVGHYNDLSAKFLVKFTNFVSLNNIHDSSYAVINNAEIIFYIADYWGSENNIELTLSMLNNDSSIYWTNLSDPSETFEEIESQTTEYTHISIPTDVDSFVFSIDTSLVNDWHYNDDLLYVNNGFTVEKSNDNEGMISIFSIDYTSTDSISYYPRMKLECSLLDTNDNYIKDSTFYVVCGGDLQMTESTSAVDDSLFYLSQGNIHRSYVEMDEFRQDTLLGPTDLLNEAELSLVVDKLNTIIDNDDTLRMGVRLFKTDYWENDSIQYLYTAASSAFGNDIDTITLDISQLIQYMISNPKETEHEGLFFYLGDEYDDFNSLRIDPDKAELNIVYTKVKDE